jgi:DDE superfamily endonuclease
MTRLRFTDLEGKPTDVLDMTSLTLDEFRLLVPAFEQAFQAHMALWRLDGQPRTARRYTTYRNCPLPTPEDRLLFILVYLKTNPLQVAHGIMFGLPQGKTNQWIHVLLPILQATQRAMGDAPARTLAELAQRLGVSEEEAAAVVLPAAAGAAPADLPTAALDDPAAAPLFAMMAPNGASRAPRTRMHRKAVLAARKSITR